MYQAVRDPQPKVFRMGCYDARLGPAHDLHTRGRFGVDADNGTLKDSDLPGGVAYYTPGLTKKFEIALGVIKFTLEHFLTINRVVLIANQHCGWYKALGIGGQEKADLLVAKKLIKKFIKSLKLKRRVKVTAFFASFTSKKQKVVTFEKV